MACWDDDAECDYDMFRDLTEGVAPTQEHPLDIALRTNDAALRCYYWEHGDASDWGMLTVLERDSYIRPPSMPETRVASGSYYIYKSDTVLQVVTPEYAHEHWMYSFLAQ